MDNFDVYLLLWTSFNDNLIKLVHPDKKKIVPYHYPPVPMLMVHEARIVAEKEEDSDIRHSNT